MKFYHQMILILLAVTGVALVPDGDSDVIMKQPAISGNETAVDQAGEFNHALLNQNGAGNLGTIEQVGAENVVEVFQSQAYNIARVKQYGSHEVFISQAGTSNRATVTQREAVWEPGDGFPGNGNPGGRPFEGSGETLAESYAHIEQAGSENVVELIQEGAHVAEIYQNGNGNEAMITQTGNSGLEFSPPGNGNPNPPPMKSGFSGAASVADVIQMGTGHFLDLYQHGENQADVYQFGQGNHAEIYQHGEMNQTLLEQFGTGNQAVIQQTGTGNQVQVRQQ